MPALGYRRDVVTALERRPVDQLAGDAGLGVAHGDAGPRGSIVGDEAPIQFQTGFFVFNDLITGTRFGPINGTAPITFGQEMLLQVELLGYASVDPPIDEPGQYGAFIDMTNSLDGFQIDEVRDALGNPIAFSVVSDSGVDWVPEPASADCALAALVVLGALARRPTRQRHRAPHGERSSGCSGKSVLP